MAVDVVTTGVICADVLASPVDALPAKGTLAFVPDLKIHLGGLAAVTAAVSCRLGTPAALIARVGDDGFGEFIVNTLEKHGVDCGHMKRLPGEGTSATVVLIDEKGERTFLHQVGATKGLCPADIDLDFVKQAKVFHWGGPGLTPGLDGAPMAELFETLRAAGVKTSIDTVFDGSGIWLPHIEAALPHTTIMMSSIEEAKNYTQEDDAEAMADFFLRYGVEAVMIKMGEDGLLVKDGSACHRLPAHQVPAVDTTGAGDAACAGFLHAYLAGQDLLHCGQLANACGGLTVQRAGGAEGVESLEQALRFMEGG